MKKFLSLLLPLAMLVSGCTQEELQNDQLDSQDGRIFTASFEQNETRTYLEEGNLLRWNAGDQIALFDGNTLNRQYQFDGENGDNSGTFSIVSNPFGTGNDLDCHYAVYPYASSVKITEGGVITATLPAVQSYAENSFGIGANTMVAVTKDVDDTFLKFKNVGGYLKLQLYGEDVTVKSIILNGSNNEKLAGKASITPLYGDEPTVTMSDEATQSITLNCGEGVKIGSTVDMATGFWIVVPPTIFERGFTITITDIKGKTFTKDTSNEITIERNVIKPMKAFEVTIENDAEEEEGSTIPDNQIWYTATAKVEPYWNDVFGANIVSNTWDSTSGNGIITFDSEVTKIGKEAFLSCSELTSVIIPDKVATIDEGAFRNCSRLYNVHLGKNVVSIGDYAFCDSGYGGNLIIPDTIMSIGNFAFCNCYITSLTIGNSVTSIGDYAFAGGVYTSVTIPNSVTSIGTHVWSSSLREFKGKFASEDGRCLTVDGTLTSFAPAGLTEYTIPNNVISIGSYAFSGCSELLSVTIPNSVTLVEYKAFNYCSSLTNITIPYSVITIGEDAFSHCTNLTSATISDGVITIGNGVFFSCSKLSNINIGNSVTTIGMSAFYGCNNLTNVIIPDSVTIIDGYAFENCSRLKSVTLGKGIKEIKFGGFYGCSNLETIYCNAETPPTISEQVNIFEGCSSNLTVYIPVGSLEAYQEADYWKDLNLIEVGNSIQGVDLGLSVKWANCNVGADSPEKAGGYYSWGETEEKSNYDHSTYLWSNRDDMNWKMTKYCTDSEYGTIDNKTVLESEDDVANVKLGDGWRMPTIDEFQELFNNCSWEWTSMNGVNGYKISGNGNSIFLPAAGSRYYDEKDVRYFSELGAYWSASLHDEESNTAWGFSFEETDFYEKDRVSRYPGATIRPVKN